MTYLVLAWIFAGVLCWVLDIIGYALIQLYLDIAHNRVSSYPVDTDDRFRSALCDITGNKLLWLAIFVITAPIALFWVGFLWFFVVVVTLYLGVTETYRLVSGKVDMERPLFSLCRKKD